MKHSSDLKFCGCRCCRYGLHRGSGKNEADTARRKFRRMVKAACKRAMVDPEVYIPERISVPYTD